MTVWGWGEVAIGSGGVFWVSRNRGLNLNPQGTCLESFVRSTMSIEEAEQNECGRVPHREILRVVWIGGLVRMGFP